MVETLPGIPNIKGITDMIKAPIGSTFSSVQNDTEATTFGQKLEVLKADGGMYEKFVTKFYQWMTTTGAGLPIIGGGLSVLHELAYKLGGAVVLPAQVVLIPLARGSKNSLAFLFPEGFQWETLVIEAEGIYFLVPVIIGAVMLLVSSVLFRFGIPATIKGTGFLASVVRAFLRIVAGLRSIIDRGGD